MDLTTEQIREIQSDFRKLAEKYGKVTKNSASVKSSSITFTVEVFEIDRNIPALDDVRIKSGKARIGSIILFAIGKGEPVEVKVLEKDRKRYLIERLDNPSSKNLYVPFGMCSYFKR